MRGEIISGGEKDQCKLQWCVGNHGQHLEQWETGSSGSLRLCGAFKGRERRSSEFKVSRSSRAKCGCLCVSSYRMCQASLILIKIPWHSRSQFLWVGICHILSCMRVQYIFIKYFKNQIRNLLLRFVRMLDMVMQLFYMIIVKTVEM